jgi:MoaA/NifB/PqqE/SkfB family radical SAM enzyme
MNRFDYYFDMASKIRSPFVVSKIWNYFKYKTLKRCSVVRRYVPPIASIYLINRCNLQCNYCGFVKDGTFRQPKQEMTLETIKRAFSHKLLKNCLVADLLGGEPLLCRDIVPIVNFLSQKGYFTNMPTNGLLLGKKIGDLKNAGIARINVSIYPENFETLKNSLPQINKVYRVHTSCVLTKTMLENDSQYIFDLINLSVDSGCKSLRFHIYIPMSKHQSSDDVVTMDFAVYNEFKAKAMEKHKNFIFWPEEKRREEKRCPYLWQNTNILPDGSLRLCCASMDVIKGVNLFENSLDEIYNSKQLVGMRENFLDNSVPPLEMCKGCYKLVETGW